MHRIQSMIRSSGADFRRNEAHNRQLVAAFRMKQEAARHARPARDLDRLARQKKMRPRERIEKLLDPGTPFLELSSLAANMAYGGDSPSASSIVGIGIVSGREVLVRADDPTVKGGAWYPLTAKKIVRALDIAMENRLPGMIQPLDGGRHAYRSVGVLAGHGPAAAGRFPPLRCALSRASLVESHNSDLPSLIILTGCCVGYTRCVNFGYAADVPAGGRYPGGAGAERRSEARQRAVGQRCPAARSGIAFGAVDPLLALRAALRGGAWCPPAGCGF